MEGANSDAPPASKVRAIQGRSVLPLAISTVVTAGRGEGGRVAVGVLVGVGEGVAVKVGAGKDVGLGVTVKVAVGRGEGVGVAEGESPNRSLIEEESQAGVSNSEDSKANSKPLLIFKLQSPLNGTHDIAVAQVEIQIGPWARRGSIIFVPPDELGRDRVFIAQPTCQINDGA